MKKIILFLSLGLFCYSLTAQSDLSVGKFKIKKFSISYGADNDMINNMGYDYFVNQIPEDQNFPLRNAQFEDSDFFSGICENPNIGLNFTLVHPAWSKLEWRNGISFMKNRYDGVSYYTPSTGNTGDYVSFYGHHDEYNIESALLYRVDVMPFLKIYGGVGTNLGMSANNSICYDAYYSIPASEIEGVASDAGKVDEYQNLSGCFETSTQFNQRVFFEVGFGLRVAQRVEVGMNVKQGVGYRANSEGSTGTRLNAVNFSASYILR